MPDMIYLSCTRVEAQRGSVLCDELCSLHPLHETKYSVEVRSPLILYSPTALYF